ncbi:MAG: hypothetical protein U0797_27140 [Gemmataceae bacterium]
MPHPAGVWAVAFHPGGGRLFTGCADGRAREWDLAAARRPARRSSTAARSCRPT